MSARGLCTTCYSKEWREKKSKPCSSCGETKPSYAKGMCSRCYNNSRWPTIKDRVNKQTRESRAANPEPFRKRDKKRRLNPKRREYEQARNQKAYVKNREKILQYQKDYYASHPGLSSHATERRKARMAKLPYDLTADQWYAILKEHNYACAYCGKTGIRLDREHKIPVCRGGGYTASNIVPACFTCNRRKGSMTDTEYADFLKKFPR